MEHISDSQQQLDQSYSTVTNRNEYQMSIYLPGPSTNSSSMAAISQLPSQDNVRNHPTDSVIHSLALEGTSIPNIVKTEEQFEHKRLRLEEMRMDFDMDLRVRQYKLELDLRERQRRFDLERLEIEHSSALKIGTKLENLKAQMDHIATKLDQTIRSQHITDHGMKSPTGEERT